MIVRCVVCIDDADRHMPHIVAFSAPHVESGAWICRQIGEGFRGRDYRAIDPIIWKIILRQQAVRSQEDLVWIGERNNLGYGHVRQFDVDNGILQNRVSSQNRFEPVDF